MNQFLTIENPAHINAITLFQNHMSLAKKSPVTIKNYTCNLRRLIRFLDRLPEECTKHELIEFLLRQKEAYGLTFSTIKAHVCALRYYFLHVLENEEFSLKIPVPKVKDYDFEVLSIEEINRLVQSCSNSKQKLIIQMLYETGMRLGELTSLRIDQIDFHLKTISIINGKGQKTRIIHFGTQLEKSIFKYLEDFPSLFSHQISQNDRCQLIKLKSRSIQRMIKSLCSKAKIKKKVTPHLLRHTFAVHYLNFGGSIFRLQKILGHQRMTSTLHYLQYAVIPEGKEFSVLDKLSIYESTPIYYKS